MKKVALIILVILVGCTTLEDDAFQGKWKAKWTTDPAGYGELTNELKFEMDGSFNFDEDELTIAAYGYDGCIFYSDTLMHSQFWKASGDTLELQNSPEEPGIQYKILSQTNNEIKLQLVEDIFITLTK
ncbi:MAG: hypothetical protein GY816_22500 [Cytophagales bacterium]|nr:hypothetical protein [Cytophagales bacterium]